MFDGLIDDIRKFASLVLTVVLIGYLTLFVVGIAGFVYTILAILAMNKGEDFVVPFTIEIINNETSLCDVSSQRMFYSSTNHSMVRSMALSQKHNHVPQVLLHIYK